MAPHPIWTRNLVESSLELAETSGKTFFGKRKLQFPDYRNLKFPIYASFVLKLMKICDRIGAGIWSHNASHHNPSTFVVRTVPKVG